MPVPQPLLPQPPANMIACDMIALLINRLLGKGCRMLETESPSGAWKVMPDVYAPKTTLEKRRVAQEFDSISMVEGEDPV